MPRGTEMLSLAATWRTLSFFRRPCACRHARQNSSFATARRATGGRDDLLVHDDRLSGRRMGDRGRAVIPSLPRDTPDLTLRLRSRSGRSTFVLTAGNGPSQGASAAEREGCSRLNCTMERTMPDFRCDIHCRGRGGGDPTRIRRSLHEQPVVVITRRLRLRSLVWHEPTVLSPIDCVRGAR
jgi:hypothetical protein